MKFVFCFFNSNKKKKRKEEEILIGFKPKGFPKKEKQSHLLTPNARASGPSSFSWGFIFIILDFYGRIEGNVFNGIAITKMIFPILPIMIDELNAKSPSLGKPSNEPLFPNFSLKRL